VQRLFQCAIRGTERRMQRLDALTARLEHPGHRLRLQSQRLAGLHEQLARCFAAGMSRRQWQLHALLHRSRALLPRPAEQAHRVAALAQHLRMASKAKHQARQSTLATLRSSLAHLDPGRVLERGYSVVRDAKGAVVTDAGQLAAGDRLDLTLARGGALVRVDQTRH
jgi:exodeoxyribonuclease VII large subunit